MPPFKIETSELEVRSVLMRLYHSRQEGEAFYPAQLVNGCAPKMEADGWIERHEQGWRLTETGVHVWAEMNRNILKYKFQYGRKIFDEMRAHLVEGRSEMGICTVKDCGKPRMVNNKGKELTMCEDHQREYWRVDAAKKHAAKKALQQVVAPQTTTANGVGKVVEVMESGREDEIAVNPVQHDCDQCEAKAVLEALKSKSPKLAALIDAMEAQERAAMELGL